MPAHRVEEQFVLSMGVISIFSILYLTIKKLIAITTTYINFSFPIKIQVASVSID
jgi:hypothetical protein